MKKQILAAGILGASLLMLAAGNNDPVLMKVGGRDVRLSEFEYLYHKNNSQQVQPQSLDEYVQMFVDYKLKVADAEAAGIDTTAAFLNEFTQFRNELAEPYLQDQAVLDSIVAENYEHMSNVLLVSHIMMYGGSEATLDSIRNEIVSGRLTFEEAARTNSIDKPSAVRGGLMGYVSAGRYPWPFEAAAYDTEVGGISPVINSGYGCHIIRVENRMPERQVQVEHILLLTRGVTDSVAAHKKVVADSLYNVIKGGNCEFGELAMRFSEDPGSAQRGGRLDWFGRGVMVNEFDSVAFAMPKGAYSEPFMSPFGWHIIHKLDERGVGTLEENRQDIIKNLGKDERGSLPLQTYVLKQYPRFKARLFDENRGRLAEIVEKNGAAFDSTFVANLSKSELPMFEVAGEKYTLAQIMPSLSTTALKGVDNIVDFIFNGAGTMLFNKVLDAAREDLVNVNPDYRNLINEYRDGILLFEISNRNVWQRAAEDKQGLETFFAANRDKYKWDTPKFKSYIIFASNDSILNEAMTYASGMPADILPADLVKNMREKFGRDVKVERVIAAKGENAITDYLAFGGDKPSSDNARWASYAAFRGRIIPSPEEAADVRGAVVADYQAELERNWVNALRQKYPVEVNNKVLQQVK